jgi:hypothetical protein
MEKRKKTGAVSGITIAISMNRQLIRHHRQS